MLSLITIMGSLALAGGSIGYLTFPAALQMGIKSAINLAENGMVYPKYMNPPVRAQSTFYLFAISNPREVLKGGKMSFELKGPFKYETILVREKITFSERGEKVAFGSGRKLVLDEAHSANLDEKIYLINPILPQTSRTVKMLIIDRVPFKRLSEPIVFQSVNLLLDTFKERLMMRTSPREIFDGRVIQLLESLMGLAGRFGLASLLPPGPPENKFGLVFVQNVTIDQMEVYTGVGQTRDRFAEVSKFRNVDRLKVWRGKCNTIEGTNGELYKPFLEDGQSIRVFLGPLCRSFDLDPVFAPSSSSNSSSSSGGGGGGSNGDETSADGLVKTRSGIMALEYQVTPRLFMGARNNPGNLCFCESARSYDCQYDGLLTMGPCFFDAPLFFAKGNFKDVHPKIKNLIDWESAKQTSTGKRLPEKQLFRIEPITGTVLEADVTFLALFKVVRQPYMRDIENVQNLTYAPLFATNEVVQLPFEVVWQIYFLQKFNDNHKLIMSGMALTGAGLLTLKFLFTWL